MYRFTTIALASCLVCGTLASNASACLNDREINNQERFFKSSYIDKPTPQTSPSPPEPKVMERLLVFGGIGAGSALLLGALVMGIALSRRS